MRTFSDEKIEEGAAILRALPKREKSKPQRNTQQTIKAMAKDIAGAQKRGYSLQEIADALKSSDIQISAATLKTYLQRAKSEKRTNGDGGLLG